MTWVDNKASKYATLSTTLTNYREARLFLGKRGTKVAIQNKADGPYIFAEKGDFISLIAKLQRSGEIGPTDYDGQRDVYTVTDDVLHVPYGVF